MWRSAQDLSCEEFGDRSLRHPWKKQARLQDTLLADCCNPDWRSEGSGRHPWRPHGVDGLVSGRCLAHRARKPASTSTDSGTRSAPKTHPGGDCPIVGWLLARWPWKPLPRRGGSLVGASRRRRFSPQVFCTAPGHTTEPLTRTPPACAPTVPTLGRGRGRCLGSSLGRAVAPTHASMQLEALGNPLAPLTLRPNSGFERSAPAPEFSGG